LVAFVLRISSPLPNVKPVDKQRLVHIRGIVSVIKPTVPHQHMKAIYSSRQERNGPPWRCGYPAGFLA
jgi:hypothetical protein